MNNNEIFLNLYNNLDDVLKEKYNVKHIPHSVISRRINELKGSPLINLKERGERLDIIRNLRNSLVHIEKFNNEDNFEISTNLIEALRQEIEDVEKPATAIKLCKPIREALTATLQDNVLEISNKMLEYGFTHVPILVNGYLFGVFSQNTIFTSFVYSGGIEVNKNDTFDKYSDLLEIDKHISEKFAFVSKHEKLEDLIPMFNKTKKGDRLAMIFVTEHGLKNEKIIGIITSYDLLCK